MSDDCIDDVGVTENSTDITVDETNPIDVTISEETTDLTISCDEITVETYTQDPITVDLEEETITVDVTEEAVTITTDCAQGPQGPPGNTLWNDTQTYAVDDIVYYDGNFYLALTINTNSTPDINPSDWQQISAGGGGAVDSVNTQTGVVVLDTDDIAEGSSNLYYTDTRVRANTLNQLTAPTTDLSLNSNKLTNVDDPTTEQDVATKNYVDTRDWKQSVRLATIAALPTNTYNNGASGIGATITINATGVLTVDGLNVAAGDRILVKNETSTLKHGIYTCTTAGAVGVSAVLTRATDCDEPNNFVGLVVYVRSGTTAIQRVYGYQGSTVPTVGTTGIVITEINRLIYSSGIANNTTTNTVTADETYLQRTMTTTAIKTANYSALAYQYVPVSTASGNVTITLQPVTNGVLVGVSHVTQGGSNTVTISAGSTVFYKFGGPTSIVMPMLNQTMYFQYYGGIWFVLGASYDTTQLDTRYTAIADAKVSDSITDAITTIAPSQNAVFDALALKEDLTNKDTDVTLSANSDTKYPSQKAVKDYIDNLDGLLPIGGDTGQRLQKATGTDYDTEWVDPPTSGIDPDTEENLLSSTPDGSGYVIATDTLRGLYYNADNTQWYITSIPLSTELANPDAGYTQDSDKRGYGDDYIYGKRLYAASLGDYTDKPVPGAIKVTHTTNPPLYQIYLRGRWNTLFYDLTMENGDFEHVPQTYSIDVRSGNSNMTGLNGQPIIREYKVDAGAYPRPVIISGGEL